ncbi:protein kinase [Acidicapsa dinghuensis]|uniref:Protein kinase n=1 Tax=Acidicapsa dinghuensis TaxID=2218256 RepID=A0ABW1EMA1_9BACT|nr:protein kinase [Acidicapsa dinghuensis]
MFDGSRFLSPEGDAGGGTVSGMVEDTLGGIWLASSRGLFRISQGKIAKIFDGVAGSGITNVAPDVFLLAMKREDGTSQSGIDAVRVSRSGEGWRLDNVLTSIGDVKFQSDASGNVLFGCDDGYCELPASAIIRWRQGQQLAVRSHRLGTGQQYMRRAAAVLRDRYGCVWLRDNTTVIYQCRTDGPVSRLDSTAIGNGIPLLYELKDGSILIPSFAKIAIGRPDRMETVPITTHGAVIPLRDGGVLAVALNDLVYLPRRLGVEYWADSDGLGGNTWSVFRQGSKMYAFADETAYVLDDDRNRWRLVKGSVESMAPGNDRSIFIASEGALQEITPGGQVVKRSRPAGLSKVFHLRDNTVWASGDTTYKIGTSGRELELLEPAGNLTDIVRMEAGPDGSIWACGPSGLLQLDRGRWNFVLSEIANLGCSSLAVGVDGKVWYTSNSRGRAYLVERASSGKFVARALPQGNAESVTHFNFIAVDRKGWVWLGSAEALYVATPQQAREGNWLRLGRTDGLPTLDTNANSFFEDRDGSIWYGADNDIIHLTAPDDLVHPAFAPAVFITGFTFDGSGLHFDSIENKVRGGHVIAAHFGSLQFDRRNALHFRYRLLPQQSEWTETTSFDPSLGKLPLGRHTLQVQAQLADGPWSPVVEQSLTVEWPVWLSWPVLLLYGAGGTGIGLGAAQWRKHQRFQRELTLPDLSAWRMNALSPETEHLTGTCLDGRYEIGHILSVGGFATVARARDLQRNGALCAVKIFRYEFGDRAWIRHRFEQEISALEQLSHPNIVRITGHGAIDTGAPYLVMEFIQGRSLREQLQEGAIPPHQIGVFLRQIAGALESLHRKAIYHRDLKPENLMIRSDADGRPEIVLIDFSIAIVKSPNQTFHGISRVAGTLDYMAPEQVIGYADASTDIYSLAKVILEMLTGLRWTELFPDATLDLPDRIAGYFSKNSDIFCADSIEQIVSAIAFDPAKRPKDVWAFARPIIRDMEQLP